MTKNIIIIIHSLMFGLYSLACYIVTLILMGSFGYIDPEPHKIEIFSGYKLNIERTSFSSLFGLTIFFCKMFIFSFICPDSQVLHSISLKKVN